MAIWEFATLYYGKRCIGERAMAGQQSQEIGGMSGAQEHGEAAMVRHCCVEASAMRAEPG